jgi:hypothetical protein
MDEQDKQTQSGSADSGSDEDVKRVGTKADIRSTGTEKKEPESDSTDRLRDGTKK